MRVIRLPNSKFRLNRTIWRRVIAKIIFNMASVRHLEFANFLNFLTFQSLGSKFASVYQILSHSYNSRLRYGDNDFQNGGRPPCCIYCDVIILRRKTEFNALDIVLNFDIHRFHTFWYTSTIIFHHFSLKLHIFCHNFHVFLKKWENIKFKCWSPQKAHLCVKPRVLNSSCLTYFYICDLYTRLKKFFEFWLSDCQIVCL